MAVSGILQHLLISIHALREEGDVGPLLSACPDNFYPRPPRGGRQYWDDRNVINDNISIHALREEGDSRPITSVSPMPYFYPRPPRGGRLLLFAIDHHVYAISIHALREEGDSTTSRASF